MAEPHKKRTFHAFTTATPAMASRYEEAKSSDAHEEDSHHKKCVYCGSEGNLFSLKCELKHKICQKCLPTNTKRFGCEEYEMYTCPECYTEPTVPSPHVWIFADNSNIWIEAMKHASKMKGFISKQDGRVRIDIGRLTDVVTGGREVEQATLYGSEPPKVDTVWKKINTYKNWRVKTSERSAVTGKEKEVDAELVTDVTEVACNTPPHLRGTIIIISGDRDICPAVQATLTKNGGKYTWKVEIHVWKHATTLLFRLHELNKKYPGCVFCDLLDNHMKKVTFLNRQLSLKREKNISNCSAVISIKQGQDIAKQIIKNEEWWKKLEDAAKWPVEYKQPDANEERYLLLVFWGMEEGKVKDLVKNLNNPPTEQFSLPSIERCELFSMFKQRTQSGRGKYVTREDGWTEVVKRNIKPSTASSSAGSTKLSTLKPTQVRSPDLLLTASAKPAQTRSLKSRAESCCSGKNCEMGLKCKFYHTDEEQKYFKSREGVGNSLRKTRQCPDYPQCKRPTNWCNYAHEEHDRWCTSCHNSGHFSRDCKNPRCSHKSHS